VLEGTFLATDGGAFQFSNLDLTGELSNTGGNIQLVSGSQVPTFVPFTPPIPTVPEPSTWAMMALGFAGYRRTANARISIA